MSVVNYAFGCCVGSWDKFDRWVAPRIGSHPVIAVSGATSIAKTYNRILNEVTDWDIDALILLHDDLEITDPAFWDKLGAALDDEPDVALVGVAGGRNVRGIDWWNYETVGHQATDGLGLLDFGERTGDVQSLEGSILVFNGWAIDHLRFDEGYPGFHGYDEISMQAIAAGKRCVVADIDTHHHTAGGFKNAESEAEWRVGAERWSLKWGQ